MPGRAYRILWGTNQENVLDLDWPTVGDVPRLWRSPRPGSELAQFNGIQDAWITGRDYYLRLKARWIDASRWSGSANWQAFFDWASDGGNTFTLVPDPITAPAFAVAGCYLKEPFDQYQIDLEPGNEQSIDLLIWHPTTDLALAWRGLMFEYAPAAGALDPSLFTLVRASVASQTDLTRGVQAAASGVLRDNYNFLGQRAAVVEPANAKANCLLWSEDFTHVAQWAIISGAPTIGTADGLISPCVLGDLSLQLLKDPNASDNYFGQPLPGGTLTGSVVSKGMGFFAKKGTAAACEFAFYDATALVTRCQGKVTWNADGSVASFVASTGTSLGFYHVGQGIYCFLAQSTTGVVAANSNYMYVYPAASGAANTGSTYMGGFWVADQPYPGSYVKTTSAIGARTADALQFNLPQAWLPQAQAMYLKFIVQGQLKLGDFATFFGLRWLTPGMGQWTFLADNSGTRKFEFSIGGHGGVTPESGAVGITAADGDTVELLGRVALDGGFSGHPVLVMRINGGAETTYTGGTIVLPQVWDYPQQVIVGNQGDVGMAAATFFPLLAFKQIAGSTVTTIAQAAAK